MSCKHCGKMPYEVLENEKKCFDCNVIQSIENFKKLPEKHYLNKVKGQKGRVICCNTCIEKR